MQRRQFMGAAGTVALGTAATGMAAGQQGDEVSLIDWFDGVGNVDGLVDKTGESEVTITVGAQGNGGAFAFGPPAVRIDPGTTVVWEWTGNGGVHDVAAEDGSFASEMQGEAGATFEQAFEEAGVVKYACNPHKNMGMRAAVIVGDVPVTLTASESTAASPDSQEQEPTGPTFDGWLEGVENYGTVADKRGQDTVTVTVGAEGNGGQYAFDPPAIRVDPGTTVVWEWTGTEGPYSVVDDTLGFASEHTNDVGNRYAMEFSGSGLSKYHCEDYRERGMRGVVLVGEGPQEVMSKSSLAVGGGLLALVSAPILFGLREHVRDTTQE
ncbi:halocyanin domain-containing protein [Haloarchaeobius sp. FL176]|uniref:halocyanin domain-containing protein n=1 Tax=Haloarchaeobius sp. FL176 TaxID=2967129 RepID=UPI002147FAC0|nr:halocyanin domain-containing protein [Haloarchaeobius sp. FL176]